MPLYRFTFADGSTSSAYPVYQSRDDSAIFAAEAIGAAKVERLPEPTEEVVIWEAPAKPKGYVVTYVGKNTGSVHVTGEPRTNSATCGPLRSYGIAEVRARALLADAVPGSIKIVDLSA